MPGTSRERCRQGEPVQSFSVPALTEIPASASLADIVVTRAERRPGEVMLRRRTGPGEWQDVSASAFRAEVEAVAAGLVAAGLEPGDRVGLMSATRYEWTVIDYAIWSAGAVTVPVYETSSAEQVEWILGDSGAVACVVETAVHERLVDSVRERLPLLRHVWQVEAGAVEALTAAGAEVPDAEVEGRCASADADSPATIVYTSGTTGRPKGCVLTHRAFLAECGNVVSRLAPLFVTGESALLL